MRLFLLSALFVASASFCSPYRVLVDRPGQWEFDWRAGNYASDTFPDGTVGFRLPGVLQSEVPGDLTAPRLQGLLALPARGAWKLEVLEDSAQVVPGNAWHRAPRYDVRSHKPLVATPRERDGWSENVVDGFRLLRMDFPLVEPVAQGARLRKHLRLRLTWQGTANVPSGSPWANAVDNPKGIRTTFSVGARRMASSGVTALEGPMVEVAVTEPDPFSTGADGVVRLTGAKLAAAAGLAPGISFRHMAVYTGISDTAPSAMADSIPVASGLRLIPIQRVDRNGDSLLDADDEIRFWVHGPNTWKATPGNGIGWQYSINPYTLSRRYLVKLDATAPSPNLAKGPTGTSPATYSSVPQPVWAGRPNKLLELEIGKSTVTETDLGKSWYWVSRDSMGTVEMPVSGLSLPGKVTDSVLAQPMFVQNTWFGGGVVDVDSFRMAGGSSTWNLEDQPNCVWSGSELAQGASTYRMNFYGSRLALSGLQFLYRRDPTRTDSGLIPAPQTGSVDISVPDGKACWVVEDGVAARLCTIRSGHLLDSATSSNTWYAYFPQDPSSVPVVLSSWKAPTQKHVVKDFSAAVSAKVLVVAPTAFVDLAEEYARHREDASFQVRPMPVAIARSEDVYSLWGGGQMDPVAIRDCIRWAHANWGVSHVLLMGSGHVDPRHILTTGAADVLMPQWEDHSVGTDDFFSYLGAGDPSQDASLHVPAVALGRIPMGSAAEGRAWLDKLETFETPGKADYGPWRNTVVLAADDVWQLFRPDEIPNHTLQSEEISGGIDLIRPWIRQEKLYLVKYPVNALYQKPEAARDLQALLNRGVVGLNYMGHGGQTVLADEDLLDNPAIDRTLVNKTRPFLFFAGSCTVGRNDVPNAKGLSEYLVVASGKGAMAAIAGTRPSYPTGNARISAQFWNNAVDTAKTVTIGEALMNAKSINDEPLDGSYHNSDIYNLLGDPAMILLPGGLRVSVHGVADTIAALSKLNVQGAAVGGKYAQVRLELQPPVDSAERAASIQPLQVFRLSPKQMIVLQSPVVSDSVSTTLQIPARISFGDSAVLRVYAWDPNTRKDGGQALSPRELRGTITGSGLEKVGPSISMRPCDSSWSAGVAYTGTAQIHLPFCVAVDLFDSSGISSETGPDEGVVFSVPGIREPWHPDLRQDVDFRHATAQLVIDSTLMPAGQTYPFDVLARDLMGNLSRARLQLEVLARTDYSLYEVFNSPNPVREGENTAFYFKLASEPDTNGTVDSRVQASIRIHTISGKLVKVLRTELSKVTQPRPRAVWDLRDSFGNLVANGIYPYTVVMRIPNATGTSSTELVRKGVVAIGR